MTYCRLPLSPVKKACRSSQSLDRLKIRARLLNRVHVYYQDCCENQQLNLNQLSTLTNNRNRRPSEGSIPPIVQSSSSCSDDSDSSSSVEENFNDKIRVVEDEGVRLNMSDVSYQPIKCSKSNNNPAATIERKKNGRSTFDDFLPPSFEETTSKSQQEPRQRVQFCKDVTVVKVQSHRDYSLSTKRRMWSSKREIYINARRNVIEYRADGLDWRRAVEEKDMWMDTSIGELVHPVHVPRSIIKYYHSKRTSSSSSEETTTVAGEV